MPWARASSLDRHMICAAASHLPMADRGVWRPGYLSDIPPDMVLPEPEPRDDSAARWGTAVHAAIADAPDASDPWLLWVSPWREKMWPKRLGEHEVSVAYDCSTKKVELFRSTSEDERTDWKMSQGRDCVVGTSDWWAELPAGEPWIDDTKTGWRKPEVMSEANLFYLMCRMKFSDRNLGWLSISWWPRKALKPGEEMPGPSRDGLWRKVSRVQIEEFEEQLHWAWVRATGPNGKLARPGAHCMWCPSALVCDKANG